MARSDLKLRPGTKVLLHDYVPGKALAVTHGDRGLRGAQALVKITSTKAPGYQKGEVVAAPAAYTPPREAVRRLKGAPMKRLIEPYSVEYGSLRYAVIDRNNELLAAFGRLSEAKTYARKASDRLRAPVKIVDTE